MTEKQLLNLPGKHNDLKTITSQLWNTTKTNQAPEVTPRLFISLSLSFSTH